jgi:hypothetical protein
MKIGEITSVSSARSHAVPVMKSVLSLPDVNELPSDGPVRLIWLGQADAAGDDGAVKVGALDDGAGKGVELPMMVALAAAVAMGPGGVALTSPRWRARRHPR